VASRYFWWADASSTSDIAISAAALASSAVVYIAASLAASAVFVADFSARVSPAKRTF